MAAMFGLERPERWQMSPMLSHTAASCKPATTSFRTQSDVTKAAAAEVEFANGKTKEVWGFVWFSRRRCNDSQQLQWNFLHANARSLRGIS